MKLCLILLGTVLLHGAAIAANQPVAAENKPVSMSPYKVVSQGWNVYWTLSYGFWGSIGTISVNEVDRGSFAGKAGLSDGDQILRINGKPVKGMKKQEMDRLLWPDRAAAVELVVQSKEAVEARTVVLYHPGSQMPKK